MTNKNFDEYISFLRENILNLVEYKQCTGNLESNLIQVKDDLFNEDPFIVFNASLAATVAFSDKTLYH